MVNEVVLWEKGYVKNLTYGISSWGVPGSNTTLNDTEETRINSVTKIAAISRGNDSAKKPASRYSKLLKEAAPNKRNGDDKLPGAAGRPLEFAPIKLCVIEDVNYKTVMLFGYSTDGVATEFVMSLPYIDYINELVPFSYVDEVSKHMFTIHTNIRACLNAGIPYDKIPHTPVDNYRVVKVKAPYFVFAQIRTHGRLSQIAASERVITEDDYWLPDDVLVKVRTSLTTEHIEELKLNCVGCDGCKYGTRIHGATTISELADIFLELPVKKVQDILKLAGYHREIYNRWPNHLKYKTWIMGGYKNDPKAWQHFLLEREAYPDLYSSWVQEQTKEVACAIASVLETD